jgi:hypothetical protein
MFDDSQETIEPLGTATVAPQPNGKKRRFRVTAATIKMLPRRRVQLGFESSNGLVSVDLGFSTVFHLMALIIEQVGAAEDESEPMRRDGKPSRRASK